VTPAVSRCARNAVNRALRAWNEPRNRKGHSPMRSSLATVATVATLLMTGCDAILRIHPPKDRVGDADNSASEPDTSVLESAPEGGDEALIEASRIEASSFDGSCPKGELRCSSGCASPGDIRTCGSCATDCTQLANVSAAGLACSNGQCVYRCAPGYADCADAGAGCATYLLDNSNCGACGVACANPTPYCAPAATAGTFHCVSHCSPPTPTVCNQSCIDEQTDSRNCGGCGPSYACTGGQTCQGGKCGCLPCVLDQSNLDQCCLQ
jgi:hypothetical protein